MYQTTKNIFSLILILILVTSSPLLTFAENSQSNVTYDMLQGGKQIFHLENEDGTIITITIEEIHVAAKLSDGAYKVTYDNPGLWKAGFTVQISNNKIVHAYAPFSSVAWGTISDSTLTRNSYTKATYKFIHTTGLVSTVTGVVATMSGTTLSISKL